MIGVRKELARGSAIGLHADVLLWQTRVIAAGGSISNDALKATNDLVVWAYANGIRDPAGQNHRIRFWLPLCTNDFNGMLIPLWHPVSNAVCINNNFVAGDYSRTNGLTGNGTTKFLLSGVSTTHVSDSSVYLAADLNINIQGNFEAIGASSNGTDIISCLVPRWSNGLMYLQHPNYTNNQLSATNISTVGLNQALRDGSNTFLFRDEAILNTGTSAVASTLPAMEYALFALAVTSGGGYIYVSPGSYQGFLIGTNLTQAQVLSWTTQYLSWRAIVRG